MTVADIAGKTPEEVTQILGSPTSTEIVVPSRTPCPCTKNDYQNSMIEIVFIEGKADWITINLPAKLVDISGSYLYCQSI